MDSRLAKVPPARATISVSPAKEPGQVDEAVVKQTIIKNVSAGKAKAYDKVELKVHNDLQVKVGSAVEIVMSFLSRVLLVNI